MSSILKNHSWDILHFLLGLGTKSSKSNVYFTFTAYSNQDQLHFKGWTAHVVSGYCIGQDNSGLQGCCDDYWDYVWKLLGLTIIIIATIFLLSLPIKNILIPRWAPSSPLDGLLGQWPRRDSTQSRPERTWLSDCSWGRCLPFPYVYPLVLWFCTSSINWWVFLSTVNLGLAMELALANRTLENWHK